RSVNDVSYVKHCCQYRSQPQPNGDLGRLHQRAEIINVGIVKNGGGGASPGGGVEIGVDSVKMTGGRPGGGGGGDEVLWRAAEESTSSSGGRRRCDWARGSSRRGAWPKIGSRLPSAPSASLRRKRGRRAPGVWLGSRPRRRGSRPTARHFSSGCGRRPGWS